MSIDLDVIPTVAEMITWGDVKNRWQTLLGESANSLLGEHPTCNLIGSDALAEYEAKLSLNTSYYFELAIPNTLGLTILPNTNNVNERDFLEDYGRNLSLEEIERYIALWKAVGYGYFLTSLGGRSKPEPILFITLATAITELCAGYVVVSRSDFI